MCRDRIVERHALDRKAADKKEAASASESLSPGRNRWREGIKSNVFARQRFARSPERAYRSDNALDIRDFRGREDMDPVRLGRELGTGPGGWPVDWRNHDDSPF